MSSEDLEKYETEQELALYREYRDVVSLFSHVVETERRFYLCNSVDMKVRSDGGEVFFDITKRRMGVGHLSPGQVRQVGARRDVQGRQHRGTAQVRAGDALVALCC